MRVRIRIRVRVRVRVRVSVRARLGARPLPTRPAGLLRGVPCFPPLSGEHHVDGL